MSGGAQARFTGRAVPRQEGRRLVSGRGRYTDDIRLPGMVHVAFHRSPYAHARIVSIDTGGAREHPGCLGAFTSDDLVGSFQPFWSGLVRGPFRKSSLYPLARGKVRLVGEAVAAVVAESRYLAEDVAERVQVEYDPLPAVVDPEAAIAPGSALLYEEWPDNVVSHQTFATPGLEDAFARAHRVVRRRFRTNRHTAAPMETRGCVADYDPAEEVLTVWIGHQDVHLVRITLAELLDMPLAKVRVIAPDTGGAFGIKLPIYPEEMVVCWLARRLGRPVKWIQDRRECLLGDTHARDAIVDAEMAVDADGRILGLKVGIISDAGGYAVAGRGPAIEGGMLAREMTGPYKVEQYGYDLKVVMTNKAPVAVYRGVAIPIAAFVMERLLENVAQELGIDRIEVRRRNLIDRFPWQTPTGHTYDTGSYRESLEKALELAGFEQLRREQAELRRQGRLVGIGICCLNDASARGGTFYGKLGLPVSGQEGCLLRVDPTGKVTAYLGTTNQGQGLPTAIAQLIADELGLTPDDVLVHMGDTANTPYGGGAWASRGAVTGGAAALLASRAAAEKIRAIAAHMLEANPNDIELKDGQASVRGVPGRSVTLREIARTAYFIASDMPPGMEPGLEFVKNWEPTLPATFSNGTHLAMVEIDRRTGAIRFRRWLIVEDCGRIINPAFVDGQIRGAVAQGLGGAIYEHLIYDENGQLVTSTFMDYLLPSAHDVPELEIHHLETPSTATVGGIKGVAEAGTVGAPAVIASAVADALGADVTELPLSPERVLQLMARAGVDGRGD